MYLMCDRKFLLPSFPWPAMVQSIAWFAFLPLTRSVLSSPALCSALIQKEENDGRTLLLKQPTHLWGWQ